MGISDQIADEFVSHAVDLQRVSEGIKKDVVAHLRALEDDLVRKIDDMEVEKIETAATKFRRVESQLNQIRKTISSRYKKASRELDTQLIELGDIIQKTGVHILNKAIGASMINTVLTRHDLETLIDNRKIMGVPAQDWWGKQSHDLSLRYQQQVRLGIGASESTNEIVQRVRGKGTGKYVEKTDNGKTTKIPEFKGGIMDVSTNQAESLVLTSVQSVNNDVMDKVYKDNEDVLKGRQALATLDLRTTAICIARSGAAWDMEGNPLPESPKQIPFPGPPPWHFRCRTVLVPITKSWEELVEETTGKKKKMVEELPNKKRASMDGEVAGDTTYEEWLEGQSEDNQKEVLGVGKQQLWKKGKLNLSELIDQRGNPLTLEQLRDKTT